MAGRANQLINNYDAPTIPMNVRLEGDQPDGLESIRRDLQLVIDSFAAHIAVLDESGTIIAINRAWSTFAQANEMPDNAFGLGANYLDVCDAARGKGASDARIVADGIRAVIRGQLRFGFVYPCHSPDELRWFTVDAARVEHRGSVKVIVAHKRNT